MKIFALSIIHAPASQQSTVLANATDLSSFSFYQKGSVGEFMTFFRCAWRWRWQFGQVLTLCSLLPGDLALFRVAPHSSHLVGVM